MAVADHVMGASLFSERFGRWPSFHDAEIVEVRLDSGQRAGQGPSINLVIHVFEVAGDIEPSGLFRCIKHSLVTLQFVDVISVKLDGFGPQNVLDELEISRIRSPVGKEVLRVGLPSNNGLEGRFDCSEVQAVGIEPYEPPPSSVYHRPVRS